MKSENEVLPRVVSRQKLLFPENPKELCRKLGLNWWAIIKLHEDSLLSFNPEEVQELDETQETEVRFLAEMITGNCDPHFLNQLLVSLPKPFSYRHSEIYYDWQAKRWRPKLKPFEPDVVFADWLTTLIERSDKNTLKSLRNEIDSALKSIQEKSG